MKKIFNFGKFDCTGNGIKNNTIEIEVEYIQTNKGMEFSACGNVWNGNYSDIVMGGQCLDDLQQYLKDNETFNTLHRLWKKYHLNGMHPECEHQRNLGWEEMAKKEVYIYHWRLNGKTLSKMNEIKNTALKNLSEVGEACITEEEQKIMSLNYSLDTYTETLDDELAEFYEPYNSSTSIIKFKEIQKLGWLKQGKHPEGILSKPCPICGYKYGSAWLYMPIPEEDDKIIRELMTGEKLEEA